MATDTLIAARPDVSTATHARPARAMSIDALRGVVMFTMIFVNDLAGAPEKIVPPWMKHFHGKSGMTFVDLVFPAFLFIVGMSIPFALGSRLERGEAVWKTLLHVFARTLSLLLIGILMVNETPDSAKMGWSGALWCTLMYISAIFAFCSISAPSKLAAVNHRPQLFARISLGLRIIGFASLAWLAFAFRGEDGHRIITLNPFSIHTEWYGILGLIGWTYFVGAIVFLLFGANRTALLGCAVLLMCLYPANKKGAFDGFWLSSYVNIGEALGSHAAITVSGILLASILVAHDVTAVWPRVKFTLWFIAGCAAAALLAHRLYGINKNDATPSWCLWASAITAALWLVFYYVCDVQNFSVISRTLSAAGRNVLLAYLISEMVPSAFECLHWDDFYDHLAQPTIFNAVARATGLAAVILFVSVQLNRLGFRLKL